MADLGTIPYTDVNAGTRIVDKTGEARAVAQALDVTKKVVDESILASATSDMVDAIDLAEQPAIPEQHGPLNEEAQLLNKMDALQLQIKNGKVSQVTLAQNQVKQILADAQSKAPWLREELHRRANQVMSGSARLAELGLEDEIRTAEGQRAQKEYQDLLDYAYRDWEQKGLGMKRTLDPETFRRQYVELEEKRHIIKMAQINASMLAANAELGMSTPAAQAEWENLLTGEKSLHGLSAYDFLKTYDFEEYLAQTRLGAQGDLESRAQWKSQNLQAATNYLIADRQEFSRLVSDTFSKIPGSKDTARGKALKDRADNVLETYDAWLKQLGDIRDGVEGAEEIIARSMAIASNDAFNKLTKPQQQHVAWFATAAGKGQLEVMKLLKNPFGLNMQNQMSLAYQHQMSTMFPHLFDPVDPRHQTAQEVAAFNSTGALQIPPGANAASIQMTIRGHLNSPNNKFIVPARNNEEELVLSLHNKDLHLQLLGTAKGTVVDADPSFANAGLLGMTYSLAYLNTQPNPPNVQEELLDNLASGALDRAINVSLTGTDVGERQAFAKEADEYYQNTKPFIKRQEMATFYDTHTIGSKTLRELVMVDAKALNDKGEFKWVIDQAALKDATAIQRQTDSASTSTGSPRSEIASQRKVERLVGEAMLEIELEMNRQIGIEMLLNKAQANNPSSFKIANEWVDHFLQAGGTEVDTKSAWANVFRYTTQGKVSKDREIR